MAAETSPARTAFDSVHERQLARTVRLAYLLVRSQAVAGDLDLYLSRPQRND